MKTGFFFQAVLSQPITFPGQGEREGTMRCRNSCLGGGLCAPDTNFSEALELAQPVIPIELLVSND